MHIIHFILSWCIYYCLLQAILSRGGRYLEAMIQGNKHDAEQGELVCLTAGDKSLFADCQSAFCAIANKSIYLGKFK